MPRILARFRALDIISVSTSMRFSFAFSGHFECIEIHRQYRAIGLNSSIV